MKRFERFEHLVVPERVVSPPLSISFEARRFLSNATAEKAPEAYPDPADLGAWRKLVELNNAKKAQATNSSLQSGVSWDEVDLAGVRAYRIVPTKERPQSESRVLLNLHGGAFVFGGGPACREYGIKAASEIGVTTYAIDYRMPPDHPYPVPLDDCVTAYKSLLTHFESRQIVVQGTSAGGNLATAMILRLRDQGVPLPAGAILKTPEVDLTESGDSFQTNFGIDTKIKRRLMPMNILYANGVDLADPEVSPLFADFSAGFIPTILVTGTRDLFLSNTVRLHKVLRQAGLASDLLVEEAGPHGGLAGAPEAKDLAEELRQAAGRFWKCAEDQQFAAGVGDLKPSSLGI